jgi:hypothetical protein
MKTTFVRARTTSLLRSVPDRRHNDPLYFV